MSFASLRILLGALCVLFALPLGRSFIRFRKGQERQSHLLGWAIRAIITGAAVGFRVGFDRITILTYTLAAVSFAAGAYLEWRPKHTEDLEKIMFPNE